MKKILLALILLFSHSLLAATAQPENLIDNTEGCGIKNGMVEPYRGCIDAKDKVAKAIFSVFPSALFWMPLHYFQERDIVNTGAVDSDNDVLERIKDEELGILDFFNSTSGLGWSGICGIFFCLYIAYFSKSQLIATMDSFEIRDSWFSELFKAGLIFTFLMPIFSGYTGFAIYLLIIACIGLFTANAMYSGYTSSIQVNDSVTDVSVIEKVINDKTSLMKNQNYSFARNDFFRLSEIATANLVSENLIKNSYPDAVVQKYVFTTKDQMLDKQFSVNNQFLLKAEDIKAETGSISSNFLNIDNLDPKIQKYAKEIGYSELLKETASGLTLQNTKVVEQKWSEIEQKLLDRMGKLNSENIEIIKLFIDHYMQFSASALTMRTEIDDKIYANNFDFIYGKAKLVALNTNTQDCLRDPEVSRVNKQAERNNLKSSNTIKVYSCGYFNDQNIYDSLLLKKGVSKASLQKNSESIISEVLTTITKARLEIEKASFTAKAKYEKYSELAKFRNEGITSLTKVMRYASNNAINQSLDNLRSAVNIKSEIDDFGYAVGNDAFSSLIDSSNFTSNVRVTLSKVFEASAPILSYGDKGFATENARESYINSKFRTQEILSSTFSLTSPLTNFTTAIGSQKGSELTKKGIESCFTDDKTLCPYNQVDYTAAVRNFSEMSFNQAAAIYQIALLGSYAADILHSRKDSNYKNDINKKKQDAIDANKNGGEISVKNDKEKSDVSNKKAKSNKHKSKKVSNNAGAMGIFFEFIMDLSSYQIIVSAVCGVVVALAQYVFNIGWIAYYVIMVAYYIIFGSIVLSALAAKGEHQRAYSYICVTTARTLFFPVVLVATALAAHATIQSAFVMFGLLVLHISIMISNLGTGSLLDMFYYLIVAVMFLAFMTAIFSLALKFWYSDVLRNAVRLIGTSAEKVDVGEALINIRNYTTLLVTEFSGSLKDNSYRLQFQRLKAVKQRAEKRKSDKK
ncbi:hypothetical protein RX914_11040 [Pseudomonas syringae pv. actinidiae]|nr:hypothetical protein [Pseudomonas syringae pv. actinidiae]MDU8258042.1 hypothetical protein [Pseudomonas syringae pv. actinidiae]MDU8261169.1 hypothetical protein [Pseudomonas syringae pv. actinidiae]MDU8295504.1 hypothetical protein [Pseudomonas syringae pv. actinidiae]MDU8311474.1 hypothetical protein [Pseudomonas syringae pv. actinidiae]